MRDFNRPNKFNDRPGNNRFGGRDQKRNFDSPTMFKAKCDECGSFCEVPFRPSGERPVLCNDCFRGGKEENRGFGRSRNDKPIFSRENDKDFSRSRSESPKSSGVSLEQFNALNQKVDRILEILEIILELSESDEEDFDDETMLDLEEEEEEEEETISPPKKTSKKADKVESKPEKTAPKKTSAPKSKK
ncbi:MAG TPA: hypothetical protein PLQ36_00575 [Candidatus Gracilibacteria bacterium]|nr:hypothetical protein [Candidatus Gracilibacteria bacterium]